MGGEEGSDWDWGEWVREVQELREERRKLGWERVGEL